MKCGARFLMLLVALTACSPSTQTAAERAAAAARADSSAAGYDVGPLTTSAASGAPIEDSALKTVGSIVTAAPAGEPGSGNSTSAPVPQISRPDTASQAGGTSSGVSSGQGAGTSGVSGRSGSATGSDTGRDPASVTGHPALDPALEPNYVAYDTTRKTVIFQLAAGDEIREQVSFNGARRGGRTFTVPLGWRVTIAFANRDPDLPHSATIVDVAGPVPEELPAPIFPSANTVRLAEGLLEGDADEILFTADRVGRYLIACGVLGHAQRGQWITLDVSTTATKPTYR